MKKTFLYRLFAALAVVSVASCTSTTLEQDIPEPQPSFPEGATVTLGFCVPYGAATKAAGDTDMKEEPFIESMHVFFFDDDGTHLVVRKAQLSAIVRENYDPSNPNEFTMLSYWTVDKVDMTIEKRILHFVANLPDDRVPKMGSESSVFRSLSVEYPRASYWQRIVLENGIQPYAYDGTAYYDYIDASGVIHEHVPVPGTYDSGTRSYTTAQGTVNEGDYINVNGDKIVNGTGYYYVPATGSPLRSMIPLIRNFVKITFVNNWAKFTLREIALVNTPAAGLVAPYRTPATSSDPRFETSYLWTDSWAPGQIPDKNDVAANGYAPLMAAAGINGAAVPAGLSVVNGASEATLYMYERGLPSVGDATSILIGGEVTYAGTTEDPAPPMDEHGYTWFRLEITEPGGDYYPFYRNFTYTLTLNGIEKPAVHGHASWEEALNHVALGNVSNAKETETLTQINDGDGLTLWVNYVDYTTVGSNVSVTVPLIYTLFYEEGGTKTYYPDRVSLTQKKNTTTGSNLEFATSNVTKLGKIIENDATTGAYWEERPSQDLDWYVALVTLKPQSSEILQNDVEVEGKTLASDPIGQRKLIRLVTYTVTQQQTLTPTITPIGANEEDRPTHLTVTLPNTLTRSAFPLSLRIEAEDNNITPLDNVTTKVGPSTFDGSTKNGYYFVKTIDYDDYAALDTKAFTFDFVTTKATTRTAPLVTRIKVTEDKEASEEHWFLSDDAHATCDLEVYENVAVTGITLDKDVAWVELPGTVQLNATIQPWEASDLAYTWSNTDDSVATVDEHGLVTAHAYGSTTVTVTTHDGNKTATCVVNVYNPITSIALNHSDISIARGSTQTLVATVSPSSGAGVHPEVAWSSSNTTVATVDDHGVVSGLAAGTAVITASATDGSGLSATCRVTVFIGVTGITLNKTEMTLKENSTEILTATVTPSNASNKAVEWESDDPTVATVNEYGEVTVVASSGTATITARSVQNNAVTATCVVTAVPNPVTSVVISETSTTIDPYPWGTKTLTASVKPSNASDTGIDWSSDDPSVATVVNGVVTAVSSTNGATTTIHAKAHADNSIEATCTITVVYTPVTGVSLDESSKLLPLGGSFTLTATVTPGDATQKAVNWTSSNNSVATVADGVVTASSSNTGTVTITATTVDGGYTATCTVQVYKPVTAVSLDKSTINPLYRRCTETLTPTITSGATLQSTTWSSNHPEIADVSSSGVVSYVSNGTARITITVTDVGGHSETAYCDVTTTDQVTFTTNNTVYTANNQATTAKTAAGGEVQLIFGNNFRNRGSNYVELNNNNTFTLSGPNGAKIKSITITYTDNNHAAGTSSAASVSGTGTVYASSGATATWNATTSSSPVTVTLTTKSGGLFTTYYPQISSITVTYE